MKAKHLLLTLGLLNGILVTAQNQPKPQTDEDTSKARHVYLPELTVVGKGSRSDIHQLPEIVGTSIFAGKKNALIVVDNVNGNIVNNTMRQIIAKVPGIHIWESDGSGIQIGIAARGLSPNRSWEFNVRQNGYDIAADPFGYPEAYYNPQLQGVQRIQIVRGAGSLQYGPQFGGLVNYILRNGSEINKPFEFETQQTAGSFGLINSYNAVGGQTEKINYYAFYDHRQADGWRDNSRYKVNNGFASFTYKFSPKFKLGIEYNRHYMLSQQPGGLTDAQFAENAKQSFRSRNWMNIIWHTAAASAEYKINSKSLLNVKLFSILGDRNSIGYMPSAGIVAKDSINPATMALNNRTVAIDQYRNWGTEARYITDYKVGKRNYTLSGGVRYYHGITDRFGGGKGDNGSSFNKNITGEFAQDLNLLTNNVAVFAENVFRITDKFIIIPGARFEHIDVEANGRLSGSTTSGVKMNASTKKRNFVLGGIGAEYHIGKGDATEIYGNITQAYRPLLFSDLTVSPTADSVDPQLKDAKGYNIDLGYRGKLKNFLFLDVSAYYLSYDNRVGRYAVNGKNLVTNIGRSISKGVELLVEVDPIKMLKTEPRFGGFSVFGSYSYTDARYTNNLKDASLKNKKVENAPLHIARAGITYYYKGLSLAYQLSYVDETFSDAKNTVATANGQNGLIPSYSISDLSVNYKFLKNYNVKAGINNLFDEKYFTRRAGGYPGPGLMPADGRGFFVSLGAKL